MADRELPLGASVPRVRWRLSVPRRPVSLLAPSALRAAAAVLQDELPGRLRTLRVEPARIDVQIVQGERMRVGRLEAGADTARVVTTVPVSHAFSTFAYDDIDPEAPRRLIRAGARRLGRATGDVRYVFALEAFADELQWLAYWRDGGFATGDAGGTLLRVTPA
jgi:hypothetical protein